MLCYDAVLQAPTLAELDPSMQALVVSHETLSGGRAINAGRAARGYAPLDLIVVPVLGAYALGSNAAGAAGAGGSAGSGAVGSSAAGPAGAAAGWKLSSSYLREREAMHAGIS